MSKYWKNHFEHRFYTTFRRRRRPHQRRSLRPQQAARNKPRYPLSFPRNRQSSSAPLSDLEFFCWLEHAVHFSHIYQNLLCELLRHQVLYCQTKVSFCLEHACQFVIFIYRNKQNLLCVDKKHKIVTIKEVVMSYYFNIQTNDSLYFKLCQYFLFQRDKTSPQRWYKQITADILVSYVGGCCLTSAVLWIHKQLIRVDCMV